jgi:mannose-6-phosphate isomerase-like protein (cupin superfamily)
MAIIRRQLKSEATDTADIRGAAKKEAFHETAEAGIKSFQFAVPDGIPEGAKGHVKLAGTDCVRASVQVLRNGGENNLHYHPNIDLIYMVLKGKVRFYGTEDKILGDYGPQEGLLLPENSRYWFMSLGDEEAWLLQIAGYPKGAKASKRISVRPRIVNKHGVWFGQSDDELERRTVRHQDTESHEYVKTSEPDNR